MDGTAQGNSTLLGLRIRWGLIVCNPNVGYLILAVRRTDVDRQELQRRGSARARRGCDLKSLKRRLDAFLRTL